VRLELAEQPTPEPAAAHGGRHPHPLDLAHPVGAEQQRPAPHRLGAEPRDQQDPSGRAHPVVRRRVAQVDLETGVEPAVELREIRTEAVPGGRIGRIGDRDLDRAGPEQPLDLGHRSRQAIPLRWRERREQRGGHLVAAPVEGRPLGDALGGEPGQPHAPVERVGLDRDQGVGLERAQQPAEIARVEAEVGAQRAYVPPLRPDLPEHARGAERPPASEELVLEGTDPLRDGAVEPAHLRHHRRVHSLTLVREWTRVT
jgi:hypothetical protein